MNEFNRRMSKFQPLDERRGSDVANTDNVNQSFLASAKLADVGSVLLETASAIFNIKNEACPKVLGVKVKHELALWLPFAALLLLF